MHTSIQTPEQLFCSRIPDRDIDLAFSLRRGHPEDRAMVENTRRTAPMETGYQRRAVALRLGQSVLWSGVLLTGVIWTGTKALAAAIPFTHHDNGQQHKQIENLEQDWRNAVLAANVPELDHLLADDYLGVTANGTLETKADLLAMRRTGTVHISILNLSDLKVRVYGDTAVVTSRAELSGTNGGTDISGHYRYTRVYNLRSGQWRIVSFEASRMADSKKH
jgi:ketosteroid isomerase-like protein